MLFKNILFASSGTAGADNAAKLALGWRKKQRGGTDALPLPRASSRGFTTNVTDTRAGAF